jgi:hypothetical protein
VAACSPWFPASARQTGTTARTPSSHISAAEATPSRLSAAVKRKMRSPAIASDPAVLDWLTTISPLSSTYSRMAASSALDCGPMISRTPSARSACTAASAIAGSSFVSRTSARKVIPRPAA